MMKRAVLVLAALTSWFLASGILTAVVANEPEIAPQLSCPSCDDYNACTVDSCDTATGTCRHVPRSCDDGNLCTTDSCAPFGPPGSAGCRNVARAAATVCDDGNACTMADVCDGNGACAGTAAAFGSACDDGNVCTTNETCDANGRCTGLSRPEGWECDDFDACTRAERCAVGGDGSIACRGPARECADGSPCTTDSCDRITGDCVHVPVVCDDGNPCTVDACDPVTGSCGRTNRAGTCDDRDICTAGESCVDGNCVAGSPADCGWGDECGSSTCLPYEQRCLTNSSPANCGPAGECGNHFDCVNGSCRFVQGSGPLPCTDNNPCTAELCVSGACTVQSLLDGAACDDASACTTNDICQGGSCRGGAVCSDGNACTDDGCDAGTGACLGSTPRNCDDGNPCTTDGCDAAIGCTHTPNTDPCDDLSACTANDRCGDGSCSGSLAVSCPDDGNVCTTDECDPGTGACRRVNNALACSDGSACTLGDVCAEGTCRPGVAANCNDSNDCTQDSCDPATGCRNIRRTDGTPCSDGNACTPADICYDGRCTGGIPMLCNDLNGCTQDSCDPARGCVFQPVTRPCNDLNPCTTGDTCVNGLCKGGAPLSCIDGNACTVDYCDRSRGCVHESIAGDCDDHDACTIDLCDPSIGCLGREPRDCDDGNACTIDLCDPSIGCLGEPRHCDDGNACTVDLCDPSTGACLGVPRDCDDGNACTLDGCDPSSGCTHPFDHTRCAQPVLDLFVSSTSPLGKGSGTVTWRTEAEWTLHGFNVIVVNQRRMQVNNALIPCEECLTGSGASYTFIVPKHKSGHGIFIEVIDDRNTVIGTYGPATKVNQ